MSRPTTVMQGQQLSHRELQCLARIAIGLTDTAIARELGISPATVKSHVGSMFVKFGVRNRAHAVSCGFTAGYLRVPKRDLRGGAPC